jgi:transposase
MERGKYLTDEEKRLIIALHRAGRSDKMIAHGFNRSISYISRVLNNADAIEQKIREKEAKRKSPLTQKQEERACELAQQGKSDKEIASELHVALAALREFMNMPRKETKSYTPPKNDISLIPCPFTSCSNRAACKEIEEPQQCPVWKLYQNVNLEKKWGKQTIRKAIEKPQN